MPFHRPTLTDSPMYKNASDSLLSNRPFARMDSSSTSNQLLLGGMCTLILFGPLSLLLLTVFSVNADRGGVRIRYLKNVRCVSHNSCDIKGGNSSDQSLLYSE